MPSIVWSKEAAEAYDVTSAEMFDPTVLDPAVDLLAQLAAGGPALEFAVGTGRVALPLSARGVAVSGIELSPHMVEQLRAKPGADAVDVVVGDMTSTRVTGSFSLVYLVWNSIMNVTTLDEQVQVFANAAAHLAPGGHFVIEVAAPGATLPTADGLGRVFSMDDDHIGIDTYDDPLGQIISSHHWHEVNGRLMHSSAPFRYIWPSELELMGRLAGLRLAERWAGWRREPFTAESKTLVAVFAAPGSS